MASTVEPPRLGRWLLRQRRLGARQAEVDADLAELFTARRATDGARSAARAYYRDVLSLWRRARDPRPRRRSAMLLDDLTQALRRLRSRPTVLLLATGMLALGIGLTTAMFTLVDALVFRPAPFHDADRLATLELFTWLNGDGTGHLVVQPTTLAAWRASPAFEAVEGASASTSVLDTGLGPIVRASAQVSPGLLTMLGVVPSRGRAFQAGDGRPGTDDRVLLSEDLWRAAFGADVNLIGQRISIDGTSSLVVGLMPSGFRFPAWNTVIWKPLDFADPPPALTTMLPQPFVRLARGVPMAAALKQAADVARPLETFFSARTVVLGQPLTEPLDPYYEHAVPLLGGGVGLVLLVLCANVGSLLLARLSARQRELRLCAALGASRLRLLRQTCLEHGCLGAAGVAGGVVLAWGLVSLSRATVPQAFLLHTLHPVDLDMRALLVAIAVGLVATVAAGVLPAWVGTRPDRATILTANERAGTENRVARALTRCLLVGEVALACTLLVGATLLIRSFINLASADRGLVTDGILRVQLSLFGPTFPDRASRAAATYALTDAVRALPGVERLVLTNSQPPDRGNPYAGVNWLSDSPHAAPVSMRARSFSVGPDFFAFYGIPILSGRTFLPTDEADDIIVGERFAAAFWPGQDPVGRSVHFLKTTFHVIGLAREIHFPSVDPGRDVPQFYAPFVIGGVVGLNIRCAGRCPPEAAVRRTVLATVPGANIRDVSLLSDVFQEELARPRAAAALGTTFAAVALLAAAGGLFSVLSYAVARRRLEFGIRIALGASPWSIRQLLFRDGIYLAVVGITVGALLAAALAKVISAVEYGVTSFDPVTWLTVVGVLAATTLVAGWHPARRAMRIDPVALLREE